MSKFQWNSANHIISSSYYALSYIQQPLAKMSVYNVSAFEGEGGEEEKRFGVLKEKLLEAETEKETERVYIECGALPSISTSILNTHKEYLRQSYTDYIERETETERDRDGWISVKKSSGCVL